MRLTLILVSSLLGPVSAQLPGPCPPALFPGDAVVGPSVELQEQAAVAAGGPGYLVVWEDERAVLSGQVNTAYQPLMGNQTDVYGARYDAAGILLDVQPIVISNLGRNQYRPRVSWNGEAWLVVFQSQRPDWYFFDDVLGVRVAPDGTVLDAEPIPIRPYDETFGFSHASFAPDVTSDGTNWLVVWEDLEVDGFIPYPTVEGTRVAPDGTLLDPDYPVLRLHPSPSFGPRDPQVGFAGGKYLLTWKEAVQPDLGARLFEPDLTPAGPAYVVGTTSGSSYRMATGPDGHALVGGTTLTHVDAGGLALGTTSWTHPGGGFQPTPPEVDWNGNGWTVVTGDSDVWMTRVGAAGGLVDGGSLPVAVGADSENTPAVAGDGSGGGLVVFDAGNLSQGAGEDVRAAVIASDGSVSSTETTTIGLGRQAYLSWCEGQPGVQLAVYLSQSAGSGRVLAQRFDATTGSPIDAEPVVVFSGTEFHPFRPVAAWNGTHYLVAWNAPGGGIVGRKLTADLTLLGFSETLLLSPGGAPGLAALGDDFLVAGTYLFSGDQSYLHGVRIDGDTLAALDPSPQLIGSNYALSPTITTLGDRWLAVWTRQVSHDNSTTSVLARFVDADGSLDPTTLVVDGAGRARRRTSPRPGTERSSSGATTRRSTRTPSKDGSC